MATEVTMEITVRTEQQYLDLLRVLQQAEERHEIEFAYRVRPSFESLGVLAGAVLRSTNNQESKGEIPCLDRYPSS